MFYFLIFYLNWSSLLFQCCIYLLLFIEELLIKWQSTMMRPNKKKPSSSNSSGGNGSQFQKVFRGLNSSMDGIIIYTMTSCIYTVCCGLVANGKKWKIGSGLRRLRKLLPLSQPKLKTVKTISIIEKSFNRAKFSVDLIFATSFSCLEINKKNNAQ